MREEVNRANKIKQPPSLTLEIVPETEQDRTVSLFHNQKTITLLLHFAGHPTQLNSLQQWNTKPQKTEGTCTSAELVFTLSSRCHFGWDLTETEGEIQESSWHITASRKAILLSVSKLGFRWSWITWQVSLLRHRKQNRANENVICNTEEYSAPK